MFSFQSRQEREFAQQVKIRSTLHQLDKQETDAGAYVDKFVALARKSRDYGDNPGYEMALRSIDQSLKFQKVIHRQKLLIETGTLALNQAKSMEGFAKASVACSNALSGIFGRLNFANIAAQAQVSGMKSEMLQENMDIMMGELLGAAGSSAITSTTREEIESLVNGEDKATTLADLNGLKEFRTTISELKQSIQTKSS